ncbi:rhodanese-like domain-containing protein 4A, chloroplastic isoform X2 [Triticum aestivum]|uniref:Rhodanese domain-containing protein n=1 Tax=Aegilops tauschii subsp. strangulata TaxID=200361 RepID=A0A453G629_AEGTS|nr:rhodanese-like domain-containing protein 4A, chloroplastic isoform X2 [Aegilops tauschii subsp. strangulata]XP_044358897.1 rhodanese-like domain-containing protein 4A, chloroplastic isoform X2 [Triticum aestivum]
MALLRLQHHCSLLQISTSHLPTLLSPPRNPRRSQPSPPNAARTPSPSISPPPAAPILARNAAAAPWRGELLLLLPAAWPLPALAAEADGGGGSKVSLESIVLAVDDFNNRNPFFVAGVVFVWLVVLPLAQEYFKKYKAVGALDAFRKLRDVPEAQLLDIRRGNSVRFMAPPNLRLVEKSAVQVEFHEEDEKGFLREVLARFPDPANTVVCVLDNFDGNSMKVAELLFNNGFKEAYAIKGGLRGPDGWQAIQENYLPPSVHVFPREKKSKTLTHTDVSTEGTDDQPEGNGELLTSPSSTLVNTSNGTKDGHEEPNGSTLAAKHSRRPLSPYANYPDLKPPSSPTPSKPGRPDENKELLTSPGNSLDNTSHATKNGREELNGTTLATKNPRRPLSPYAKYPDLKPPSSPTPSKPGR